MIKEDFNIKEKKKIFNLIQTILNMEEIKKLVIMATNQEIRIQTKILVVLQTKEIKEIKIKMKIEDIITETVEKEINIKREIKLIIKEITIEIFSNKDIMKKITGVFKIEVIQTLNKGIIEMKIIIFMKKTIEINTNVEMIKEIQKIIIV